MKNKKNTQGTPRPREVSPLDLDVVPFDGSFALSLDGEVLLTNEGTPVAHAAAPLLEHILREFDGHGHIEIDNRKIVGPRFFGAFALFGIQKAWVEPKKDDLALDFEHRLLHDPVLHPVAGPEQVDQRARWVPLDEWLGETTLGELRGYAQRCPCVRSAEEEEGDAAAQGPPPAQIASHAALYRALPPEQRTVVQYFCAIHEGPVLFPMALVLGKCSVEEYAMGVMAGHAALAGTFADVKGKDHRKIFETLCADARAALDYLRHYREGMPDQRLKDLVAAGESTEMEFKSTLRWNVRANRVDEAVTHACAKTVAAFLNTVGGRLVIGVADDRTIVGIEQDGFDSIDRFQLHLFNVLKQNLGEAAATHVTIELLPSEDARTVCVVTCEASPVPVYCRTRSGEEQFFVRTGPGTTQLPPSELVPYVAKHFQGVGGRAREGHENG